MTQVDHNELLEQRGEEYGDSWSITSEWICENAEALAKTGSSAFPLVMIHNKLIRALTSPGKQDHYDDIIGYAKLALRRFEHMPSDAPLQYNDHWILSKE